MRLGVMLSVPPEAPEERCVFCKTSVEIEPRCRRGFAAEDILGSVQPQLAASTGAACASGIPEPSHVLRAMGLSNAEASSSIRFSFGRFTTNNEVEEAARLIIHSLESVQESVEPSPIARS